LSLGATEEARVALTHAIEVDRGSSAALEARLNERKLSEAANYAARAAVSRTRLEYRAAASDFATAAEIAARWDTADLAWRYTLNRADNLLILGDEFGDSAALAQAIENYREALKLAQRKRWWLDWAMTQNRLGDALRTLGERQSDTARLEEAVAAFREALKEETRARAPNQWAEAQFGLGNALSGLGRRAVTQSNLDEALGTLGDADALSHCRPAVLDLSMVHWLAQFASYCEARDRLEVA
jgi:tetratricopeptide (TPR) repeat protein